MIRLLQLFTENISITRFFKRTNFKNELILKIDNYVSFTAIGYWTLRGNPFRFLQTLLFFLQFLLLLIIFILYGGLFEPFFRGGEGEGGVISLLFWALPLFLPVSLHFIIFKVIHLNISYSAGPSALGTALIFSSKLQKLHYNLVKICNYFLKAQAKII